MFKLNQTIYRVSDPDDGGDYVPQMLKVVAVMSDAIVVQLFNGQTETITSDAERRLYASKLECAKECWRLNGTGDAFDQLCSCRGVVTPEAKRAELNYQMDMWGALDYDELLECLI